MWDVFRKRTNVVFVIFRRFHVVAVPIGLLEIKRNSIKTLLWNTWIYYSKIAIPCEIRIYINYIIFLCFSFHFSVRYIFHSRTLLRTIVFSPKDSRWILFGSRLTIGFERARLSIVKARERSQLHAGVIASVSVSETA